MTRRSPTMVRKLKVPSGVRRADQTGSKGARAQDDPNQILRGSRSPAAAVDNLTVAAAWEDMKRKSPRILRGRAD